MKVIIISIIIINAGDAQGPWRHEVQPVSELRFDLEGAHCCSLPRRHNVQYNRTYLVLCYYDVTFSVSINIGYSTQSSVTTLAVSLTNKM